MKLVTQHSMWAWSVVDNQGRSRETPASLARTRENVRSCNSAACRLDIAEPLQWKDSVEPTWAWTPGTAVTDVYQKGEVAVVHQSKMEN